MRTPGAESFLHAGVTPARVDTRNEPQNRAAEWPTEHYAFLATVQHKDIRDLYVAALYGDYPAARQHLTTIVEVAWAPFQTWTPREREAARAIRLLIAHSEIHQPKEKGDRDRRRFRARSVSIGRRGSVVRAAVEDCRGDPARTRARLGGSRRRS